MVFNRKFTLFTEYICHPIFIILKSIPLCSPRFGLFRILTMMRILFILLLLVGTSSVSKSQNFEIGALGGGTLFIGDYPSYRLTDSIRILASPGFGIFFRKPFSDRLALRGSVYFTRFRGDDALIPRFIGVHNPPSINRPNTEFQFQAEYTPLVLGRESLRPISFFLIAGFGFSKTTISDSEASEECPIVNLIVPFGGGIRMPITEKIKVFAQLEGVQGLNDCLDGFIDPSKTKDFYYSFKVGVSTTISPVTNRSGEIGCPSF
jgi:hypothetical protein